VDSATICRMASLTINRPDLFPNGTTVKAYKRTSPAGNYAGVEDDSKTISSDSATFSVTEGYTYVVIGSNGARLQARPTESTVGLAATALKPPWKSRRQALGLK
jgi:hypothetical protein